MKETCQGHGNCTIRLAAPENGGVAKVTIRFWQFENFSKFYCKWLMALDLEYFRQKNFKVEKMDMFCVQNVFQGSGHALSNPVICQKKIV